MQKFLTKRLRSSKNGLPNDDTLTRPEDGTLKHSSTLSKTAGFRIHKLPTELGRSPFTESTFSMPLPDLPHERTIDMPTESFRLMDLPVELRLHTLALLLGNCTVPVICYGSLSEARTRRDYYA